MSTPAPILRITSAPAVAEAPLPPARCAEKDRPLVLAWARAHGIRGDRCDDVAQEAFLRLVNSSAVFPCRAAQVAWLRRVTSNLCVDFLRLTRPLDLSSELAAPRSSASISPDERRALTTAIQALTEMQRLVLVAKAVEELTFAALADELGISIPTAKTHYRRAIEALRLRLHEFDLQEQSP
ncbi:MAG: sigma-70 family RNA polymerase sigma factor [Phycisphaeraceae bacterium]|nr:sigma-70 family RNA polymerase sigma factor [Phycisphaeraceae bacterium]